MLRMVGWSAACLATGLALAAALVMYGPDLSEAMDGIWP